MQCSICGGPVGLLGILGKLAHLLCQSCGMHFNCPAEDIELITEEEEEDE